jgi:hopanoid biosynthesis associated protein HpnK
VRRLIVNADDFGLTPGVNRAIIEGHASGVVTSATLMANAAGFEDAVRLAKSSPGLSVGCHVVLVDGAPVSNPSQVPTLTDSAQFEARLTSFAMRAVAGSINSAEVETEVAAQIRKIAAEEIQPSHLDTHKHTHVFPQILRPLLRAAKACGVRAIRNPFGRVAFSAVLGRPKLWKRYGELMLLNPLARNFLGTVRAEGMITPDGSVGVAATGALDEELFRQILENLPEGTWEFVTHPGYNDAALDKVRTRLRQSRETELRILTSEAIRETVRRNGIELISYRELISERL